MAERSRGSGRCRPWSSGIRISPSSPCSSTRRRGPSVSCEGPRAESAVSSSRELERDFATAILGGPDEAIAGQIQGDGLEPAARIAVYRHDVFVTLTEALEATYPVVVRLVDRRFFPHPGGRDIPPHSPGGPGPFKDCETFASPFSALPARPDPARPSGRAAAQWGAKLPPPPP